MPFPELNLKQAWLIPSSRALPNPNGTAPGWFVSRPDGRVAWRCPVHRARCARCGPTTRCPVCAHCGLGADVAVRTYRLTGIGESQVAEILGEELLRRPNPEVATYARAEAVDVRVSAVGGKDGSGSDGRAADELVEEAAAVVTERLADHVWAEGETTWSEAIGARLGGARMAARRPARSGPGPVGALFGDVDWMTLAEARPDDRDADTGAGTGDDRRPASTSRVTSGSAPAPRSASRFARANGAATPPCRSQSSRPSRRASTRPDERSWAAATVGRGPP